MLAPLIVFEKDKEYIVQFQDKTTRAVILKVLKCTKGNIKTIDFYLPDFEDKRTLTLEEFNILSVPITNTDFFEMYINWNNWNKEGVHQDLEYAYNLKIKILTTLRTRDIVKFGDGKFEDYDYKRLDKLCNG